MIRMRGAWEGERKAEEQQIYCDMVIAIERGVQKRVTFASEGQSCLGNDAFSSGSALIKVQYSWKQGYQSPHLN